MPEGDTIYRTALTLRQALGGETVTAFSTRVTSINALGCQRFAGKTVAAVEARGKHLLIRFAPSQLSLHTHMRMAGSWHLYRPGERWRKPQHLARVVIDVATWTAVCFSAPVIEMLTPEQVRRHPVLSALGPDALDAATDLREARRRLDERADWAIGEALRDQRVLAGVGNVYANEVLFVHAVDPWTRVADIPAELRDAMLSTAERLLKDNVKPGSGPRITTAREPGVGDTYAYGRAGRPCPRCAAPIQCRRQGVHGRLTYWCVRCQGPGSAR